MKNARFESLGRMQRLYHRRHPWNVLKNGLYVPHSYDETKPDDLSWWDDVGFILNKRRVMVWWRHPRDVYFNAMEEQSWKEAGDEPGESWLLEGGTKNYRAIGKSRKKIISYICREPSAEWQAYYKNLMDIRARLAAKGIEFDIHPSWKRRRLEWADGIDLVAPLEVRNEAELSLVALLARRLMLGQTTLEIEFPGFQYGKTDWVREQEWREPIAERG